MWLNIFSSRSFNDMTQYPVLSWTIINNDFYEINEEADLRDLSFPMGMQEISDKSQIRKETFKEINESIKNNLNELELGFNYQEYL